MRTKTLMHRLGRWAIDLVLLFAIIYLGQQVITSAVTAADKRAGIRALEAEAHALYDAFDRYFEDNRSFPSSQADPRFDPATLDPLRKRGYYRGVIVHHLRRNRVDAYESPDDRGTDREFWLEMTLAADPSIRYLICRSDDAPLGGGEWLDGVFVLRDGALEPL